MRSRQTHATATPPPSPEWADAVRPGSGPSSRSVVASSAGARKSRQIAGLAELSVWLVMCISLAFGGCTSQSAAKANAQKAFVAGQQRAAAMQQQGAEPAVWVRGDVRNPRIPWTEDLTLAQALLAADYAGRLNPTKIQIVRQGRSYPIDVRRLLRGTENPLLEPGDVIEVVR